ncbi:glycosyltransferase family 2 protein [Oceanisphaera avium]|uniref:Glycosyl transferase n=1 Tax=Oceanisphaera avium TaxID=1903694 RepID=A0A1Y0D035_9GAMM|nr:glycosyltransferase family A protein [Oceanisphaera avium]ART80933.1 hypothetical protein CBP12_12860 [Oceanisphaera avium]
MKAFVVVATKGRAKETFVLLDYLQQQSLLPSYVVVIGSEESDIAGLNEHPLILSQQGELVVTTAGSCHQRNVGLDVIQQRTLELDASQWFVTFFDDDFRPATDWLAKAGEFLRADSSVMGVTGHVLADGVGTEFGISELEAQLYLNGSRACEPHWSHVDKPQELNGLYGCNMVIRGTSASHVRFDENLPLYGWQEDYDFANRSKEAGHLYVIPGCKGVHLGTSSGRTSGVKFGYSQIANPIYLAKKGTMPWHFARRMMFKNIAANIYKSLTLNKIKDYPGRLRGNLKAFGHLILNKLSPTNVLNI